MPYRERELKKLSKTQNGLSSKKKKKKAKKKNKNMNKKNKDANQGQANRGQSNYHQLRRIPSNNEPSSEEREEQRCKSQLKFWLCPQRAEFDRMNPWNYRFNPLKKGSLSPTQNKNLSVEYWLNFFTEF